LKGQTMADVVLVNDIGGDWIAMYVDGKIVREGHSLSESTVIDLLLGKSVDSFTEYGYDFEEIGLGYETLDEYTDLAPW